jgi:NAD(P)-dependent dehydrogenase (short-subunit alcohol dehydrogenase family)
MSGRAKVLISGASRGLGAETAVAAAQLGADLVLTARNLEGLQKTAARVRAVNPELSVEVHAGDLADNAFCQELAGRFEGGLDSLILNAAMVEPIGPLDRTDDAQWTQAIELNLLAPARLARRLLPALVKSQGRLITVGTGAATSPISSWSAYCASKAGLLMLTRVIALEYPQITALSLSPGVVDTVMQQTIRERHQLMPSELANYFQNLHAGGQLVPPQIPGRALAWVALHAPREWSGFDVQASDPELVQRLQGAFPS